MKGRDLDGNIVDPSQVVTYAAPGASYHNFALAVDSCFKGSDPYLEKMPKEKADEYWSTFGKFCKLYGLEWGGDFSFKDKPHAQIRYGMTLRDIQRLWQFGGLSAIFTKLDTIIEGG